MKKCKPRVLKAQARQLLSGNYSFFVLLTMLLLTSNLLLGSVLSFLIPSSSGLFGMILYLAGVIIVNTIFNVLLAGMYRVYRNLVQSRPLSFHGLFYAFLDHPEPIAVYSAAAVLIQLLCMNLGTYVVSTLLTGGSAIFLILLAVVSFLYLWFVLTFQPVLFLHSGEPALSTRELFRRSHSMMRGHRLAFLWLQLTFLGVLLLAVLSLGIGMLFVTPYMITVHILFYQSVES